MSASFFPDFFILGAPKCGTTALHTWLGDHPGIFMSRMKEPHYFSTDMPGMRNVPDWAAYSALFEGAPPGSIAGESSTSYLQSVDAVPAILERSASARFIALVRNPVEMAPALHAQLYYNVDDEDVADFEAAWRLQDERAEGRRLPRRAREPRLLQYRRGCALGDQIERLATLVPPERRLVLLFDDLRRESQAVYSQVLDFLGVPNDGRSSFEPVNTNKTWRSKRLADFHRRLPARLGALYRPARTVAARLGFSPSEMLDRYNLVVTRRPPLSEPMRAELARTFAPQVEKLSRLLGRDLGHWLERPR